MDDFNEKDGLGGVEEPNVEEEIEAVEDTAAELDEEAVGEDGEAFEDGIAITPDDGEEIHYTEEDMCILCGENVRDYSVAPDYDLCSDCRAKLARTPLKFIGFAVIILLLGACYWAGFMTYQDLTTVQTVLTADEAVKKNACYTAINAYAGLENSGDKTAKKLVKIAYQCGYLSLINETVEGNFSDYQLSLPWNKDVKKIYDDYNTAMKSYDKAYEVISEVDEKLYYGEMKPDEVEYDKLISELDALKTDKSSKNDLTFIAYTKYSLTALCQKGNEAEEKYLLEIQEISPEYEWLYLRALAQVEANLGKGEEVKTMCKRLRELNSEDYYADYYEEKILRKSGDYNGALEIALELEKGFTQNNFAPIYYEITMLYMLKGDNKTAFEWAEKCYANYLTLDTCNIYALLAKLTGNADAYKEAEGKLQENDYEVSEKVQQFLDGKLNAVKLFREGDGEF